MPSLVRIAQTIAFPGLKRKILRFAPSVHFCPRRIASSGSEVGYFPLRTCTVVQRQPQPLGGRNARIARYKKLFHSDNHILWELFAFT